MDADEYEQIRQLLGRYDLAIDLGDTDGWAACFTPDGAFQCSGLPDGSPLGGRHEGTDALRASSGEPARSGRSTCSSASSVEPPGS
jgi:hypothetical protein